MPDILHENGFDDIGTHYSRFGAGDAPNIVLIHGLGMDQNFWQPQMIALAGEFQTVAYDILGHGESPMPEDDVSLDDLVDQLHGLLHELQISEAHIVGHSMGALIATGFALAHPEQTSSLIAMNGVYDRPKEVREAAKARATEILASGNERGNATTFQRWFGDTPRENQKPAIQWIKETLAGNDATGYGRIYNLFAQSDDAFVGKLENLACQALFLTGALDPNSTPKMSLRMADAAPHGRAVAIENERHMMSFVSPDQTNEIILDFLHGECNASQNDALGE
jgi:pimeloyl-ACP methyl ester carboxylesterase